MAPAPPKFLGVQGIDNDYSFVVNTGANFTKIENMGIITEQMAQKVLGVQGIDNDFSFVRNGVSNFIGVKELGIITETMANKVLTMTRGMLESSLMAYGLSPEEVDSTWSRTVQLQGAIREGMEYYQEKAPGQLEDNHLRVVKDQEMGQFGPDSNLYRCGLFKRVLQAPRIQAERQAKSRERDLDSRLTELRQSAPSLSVALNGVDQANRGFFIGSKRYDSAMESLRNLFHDRNGLLENADPQQLEEYARRVISWRGLLWRSSV